MKLSWISKEKGRAATSGADVTMRVIKDGRCALTFRNGSAQKISKTGYIQLAVYQNKLYFREADAKTGYCLANSGTNSENKSIKLSHVGLCEFAEKREGNYALKGDVEMQLYYIDCNEPEKAWI